MWASNRARASGPLPAISHRAASVPSALVPDMSPTTSRAGRSRSAISAATGSAMEIEVADYGPQRSLVLDEKLARPLRAHPGVVHDQRDLGSPTSLLEQLERVLIGESGQTADDAHGPRPQLGVGGADVDHQSAVGLSQQHERGGGQGIEHQ